MVESGQAYIRPVDFDSRRHPDLPVEVIERRELLTRVTPRVLAAPQRPSFHLLLLIRSGNGSHTVDFSEIPAEPRRLIQVRPGQVQAWNTREDMDAAVILSRANRPKTDLWFPGHASYADLDSGAMTTAASLVASLAHQQAHFGGDPPTTRLMVALFDALVAVFDQARAGSGESHLPEAYVAFRTAVESDFTRRHDVVDYADHLGYSARTLTRACQRATGQTAKRVLTDRLVLEAKRLLVHTSASAASISAALGFSEATNFTKFFARHTAQTPSAFRRRHGFTG